MPSIVVGPRVTSDQTNKTTYPHGIYILMGYWIMGLSLFSVYQYVLYILCGYVFRCILIHDCCISQVNCFSQDVMMFLAIKSILSGSNISIPVLFWLKHLPMMLVRILIVKNSYMASFKKIKNNRKTKTTTTKKPHQ